ncbi:hypothetical protein [Chitinophaga sp. S165]|uniref:hypothetical protein n=1 Tax=Chitinophaga sp. S165 TaxID=2135462 RepID=UPI000D81893E|nr:hypothetical protein [Chitinophaga sp. S165]PWV47137.1 hypothetical protein C7475_109225 [Chitinophaga sp. S165]
MRKRGRSLTRTSETITTWIAKAVIGMQRRWATWMTRRTRKWGPCQQAHFLYLILLVFGGASTYLLVDTINGDSDNRRTIDKQTLAPVMPVPKRPRADNKSGRHNDIIVFKRFHAYIDSVRKSRDSVRLDSFFDARPHFMDSVWQAESLLRQFHH